MHRTIPLLAALLLAGCASLAPGAIGELSRLDPMTADPAAISLVAVMPKPIRLRSGDAVMQVKLAAPPPHGPIDESLALEVADGAGAPGVSVDGERERAQLLRFSAADATRLAGVQRRVQAYRAAGGKRGTGELGVELKGGCLDGPLGKGPLIARIYMRTAPAGDYFPVVRGVDLGAQFGEDTLQALPACD